MAEQDLRTRTDRLLKNRRRSRYVDFFVAIIFSYLAITVGEEAIISMQIFLACFAAASLVRAIFTWNGSEPERLIKEQQKIIEQQQLQMQSLRGSHVVN